MANTTQLLTTVQSSNWSRFVIFLPIGFSHRTISTEMPASGTEEGKAVSNLGSRSTLIIQPYQSTPRPHMQDIVHYAGLPDVPMKQYAAVKPIMSTFLVTYSHPRKVGSGNIAREFPEVEHYQRQASKDD